jgi:hypothetical protein
VNDVVKSALAMMSVALMGGLIIVLTHACAGEHPASTPAARAYSARTAVPAQATAQDPSGVK